VIALLEGRLAILKRQVERLDELTTVRIVNTVISRFRGMQINVDLNESLEGK